MTRRGKENEKEMENQLRERLILLQEVTGFMRGVLSGRNGHWEVWSGAMEKDENGREEEEEAWFLWFLKK